MVLWSFARSGDSMCQLVNGRAEIDSILLAGVPRVAPVIAVSKADRAVFY